MAKNCASLPISRPRRRLQGADRLQDLWRREWSREVPRHQHIVESTDVNIQNELKRSEPVAGAEPATKRHCGNRVVGGKRPNQQEEARDYLKSLWQSERYSELQDIMQQLVAQIQDEKISDSLKAVSAENAEEQL